MLDELIVLLSTDWFLPCWTEIGIEIAESKKLCIQKGCREVTDRMLRGAENEFFSDFSEARMRGTESDFLALLQRCEAQQELFVTYKEWATLSDQDIRAAWSCSYLNLKITSGVAENSPPLDPMVRAKVAATWGAYDVKHDAFLDVSLRSGTDWDRHVQIIWCGPKTLPGQLHSVLQYRELRAFWEHLRVSLTPQQLHQLVTWYREMHKIISHKDRPDLIPSYME